MKNGGSSNDSQNMLNSFKKNENLRTYRGQIVLPKESETEEQRMKR